MNEVPIVRHFIACQEIESDGRGVTLHQTIHAVVRLPGETFPCIVPRLSLFILMTNGRGTHDFSIELVRYAQGEEELIRSWGPITRDLGEDPAIVHGLPVEMSNVVFPLAGQYEFRLLCRGRVIAVEKLSVR